MKKIFICLLISLFLYSCVDNKADEYIKKAWKLDSSNENNLAYSEKVCDCFKQAQLCNPRDWESGYVQECQYLVGLYFKDKINKNELLKRMTEIYNEFMKYSEINDQNKYSYAILMYLTLDESKNKSYIKSLYNPNLVYKEVPASNQMLWNFLFGIILNDIDKTQFSNSSFYSNYLELNDDVLIECFFQVSGSDKK
jgi:hypothetical protein